MFVTEPDDPFYIFNETNVTLKWEYKVGNENHLQKVCLQQILDKKRQITFAYVLA